MNINFLHPNELFREFRVIVKKKSKQCLMLSKMRWKKCTQNQLQCQARSTSTTSTARKKSEMCRDRCWRAHHLPNRSKRSHVKSPMRSNVEMRCADPMPFSPITFTSTTRRFGTKMLRETYAKPGVCCSTAHCPYFACASTLPKTSVRHSPTSLHTSLVSYS